MQKSIEKIKIPSLSPRLETIIQMIAPTNSGRIIDVGTDHSLIPIKVISMGIRNFGIATDIRKGPLEIADCNIEKYGLKEKIQLIHTDGLKGILIKPDDCIVIAGMGGYEIISILKASLPDCENIILQPQKSIMELRQFLSENGYFIEDEKITRENNRFYIAIKVKYTGEKYSLNTVHQIAGPVILIKKPENFKEYIYYLIQQLEKMKKSNKNLGFVKSELEKELIIFENQ